MHILPRRGRGARNRSRATTKPTMDLEAHSINLNARREQEEVVYDRVSQRLIDVMGQQLEKKFGIERLRHWNPHNLLELLSQRKLKSG